MGEGPIPRMMQGRETRGHEPPNVVERGGGMEIGAARRMRQRMAKKGIVWRTSVTVPDQGSCHLDPNWGKLKGLVKMENRDAPVDIVTAEGGAHLVCHCGGCEMHTYRKFKTSLSPIFSVWLLLGFAHSPAMRPTHTWVECLDNE